MANFSANFQRNNIVAMASQMKALRYSLRGNGDRCAYCPRVGSKHLLKPADVRTFMKQYTKDNVENSLKDLNRVDFWWILATNTKEFQGIFDSIHEGQKAISKKAIRKPSVSANFPSDSFPRMFKLLQNVFHSHDSKGQVKELCGKKKRTR